MLGSSERKLMYLVQQGVWDMPVESMPLAAGYIKAAINSRESLAPQIDCQILNFKGGSKIGDMIARCLGATVPDVLAISVFGWNHRQALVLAETFKQVNPDGLVILGGTHVANQAARYFSLSRDIDVIVNGEGEPAIIGILEAWLAGELFDDKARLRGFSVQYSDGSSADFPDYERISDLDSIESPFLSGAIQMSDRFGKFRYDVALMETNRGCPYHCAFCYWGGAVGQKMRRFSRDRLRAELDVFSFYQVDTIVLCDSNFGMQPQDEEFLEDLIHLKEKNGFPRALETSWAKNKSGVFERIVRQMKAANLHSSFTLALQTLDENALADMNRRNMKINDWTDLAGWLTEQSMDCYAELLWGAPGETVTSFFEGYDRLAERVPRIATYPLMLLPNTDFSKNREKFGFLSVRGESDDFEYVIGSKSYTIQENLEMQSFLLWARAAAENSFFRYLWKPLRIVLGMRQSTVLLSLAEWFDRSDDPASDALKSPSGILDPVKLNGAVRALLLDVRVRQLVEQWWDEIARTSMTAEQSWILGQVFRLDIATLPIARSAATRADYDEDTPHPTVFRTEEFDFDVLQYLSRVADEGSVSIRIPDRRPVKYRIEYRLGIENYVDNHEEALLHMGRVVESDCD